MNQATKGYIAGIIDGEGYIAIVRTKRGPSICDVKIVVTSTHEILTQRLVEMAQAGYYKRCQRKRDGRRIPSWAWHCYGQAAVRVLRKIRSQLIIKQDQADWILKFADYLKSRQNPKSKMSEEDKAFGCKCEKEIRLLNSRERNKRLLREYAIAQLDPWKLL